MPRDYATITIAELMTHFLLSFPFWFDRRSGRDLGFLFHFVRVVTAFCFVLHRSGTVWENCRAAYEDIVKHLER